MVKKFSHNEALINQLRQPNLSSKTVHYEATQHLTETKVPILAEKVHEYEKAVNY